MDPDANRAGFSLITKDADAWHARMTAVGLPVPAIEDQPWGMREFAMIDPSGNRVRIGGGIDGSSASG